MTYVWTVVLGGRRFLPQAPRSYPIPMAHRVTPGKPEVTGSLAPRHRWFGKQSSQNVSVPLRNTYLIPSPSVIKPC